VDYNEANRNLEGTDPDRDEAEDSLWMQDPQQSEQVSKSKNNLRPLKKLPANKLLVQKIGKNSYSLVNPTGEPDARMQFSGENLMEQDPNGQKDGKYHQVKSSNADEDYQMMQ